MSDELLHGGAGKYPARDKAILKILARPEIQAALLADQRAFEAIDTYRPKSGPFAVGDQSKAE